MSRSSYPPPALAEQVEPERPRSKIVARPRLVEAPRVRGHKLRSLARIEGAERALAWWRRAIVEQQVSRRFIAHCLGVDPTWVEEVEAGHTAPALGDAWKLPRSMRRSLGIALVLSAESTENDNGHE